MVLEVTINVILDSLSYGSWVLWVLVTQVYLPCENSLSYTLKFLHFPVSMLSFN